MLAPYYSTGGEGLAGNSCFFVASFAMAEEGRLAAGPACATGGSPLDVSPAERDAFVDPVPDVSAVLAEAPADYYAASCNFRYNVVAAHVASRVTALDVECQIGGKDA